MDKVRELKINSTLWATPSRLVNLLNFKPEKLSIKTKSNTNNDIKVHQVRYENGGFYLTIDNLEGNLHKEIRLFDDDLPIGYVFKIHLMTIVIRSLIEKNNKFF